MGSFRSFKDQNNIFFLLQYIQGHELFDVIRELGLLSTSDTQFYIGTIILCLEYFHNNKIVYRDLKPENLMIDEDGYVVMVDMGTAKILPENSKTFTIIGTPHYMAPEIM